MIIYLCLIWYGTVAAQQAACFSKISGTRAIRLSGAEFGKRELSVGVMRMVASDISCLLPGEFIHGYLASLQTALAHIDVNAVEKATQMLQGARDAGATIFLAGNGGSAATASHWANDLGKATKRSRRKPIRVMSLTDNVSWLTALGNDEGYDRIFAGQMENFVKSGDLLVVISASGNSRNLVQAVELAREHRAASIGMVGFDGGTLKNLVDQPVWVRSEKGAYELVEDVHSAICHAITRYLVADRPELGQ